MWVKEFRLPGKGGREKFISEGGPPDLGHLLITMNRKIKRGYTTEK